MKANQGKLSFGSAGAGSTTHVAAVMVLKAAGLDMVHVPYRGVAPAFTDLLAGHVLMVAGSPVELKPYIDSGKLKVLGLLDSKPSPFLPDVPLVTETLKDCPPAVTYNGLLAPKGVPQEVVDTLRGSWSQPASRRNSDSGFPTSGLQPCRRTRPGGCRSIAKEVAAAVKKAVLRQADPGRASSRSAARRRKWRRSSR